MILCKKKSVSKKNFCSSENCDLNLKLFIYGFYICGFHIYLTHVYGFYICGIHIYNFRVDSFLTYSFSMS